MNGRPIYERPKKLGRMTGKEMGKRKSEFQINSQFPMAAVTNYKRFSGLKQET
jgi:hypothetical protein